jgi:hypothetical protein
VQPYLEYANTLTQIISATRNDRRQCFESAEYKCIGLNLGAQLKNNANKTCAVEVVPFHTSPKR